MNDVHAPQFHGAFNARWLSMEQVARQFVPVSQFYKLIHERHSLLLGPRGSGKTTLLKMLTRRALDVWYSETENDTHFEIPNRPAFEAIYIPSDVRWSYELRHLERDSLFPADLVTLTQRLLVCGSALLALCESFESFLPATADDDREDVAELCSALIELYELQNTLPNFRDIAASVEVRAGRTRGVLNRRDPGRLEALLSEMPDIMFGHVVDPIASTCKLFDSLLRKGQSTRWALCFDELEIAPTWMRQEVLESFRSIDQAFLLKLTYSPLLPTGYKTNPEPSHDYQKIRLWNSHAMDAKTFCEDLTTRFLKGKTQTRDLSPDAFFRFSVLAAEDDTTAEASRSYDRQSVFYRQATSLTQTDQSFSAYLVDHHIDPQDPYTEDPHVRDTVLRKIKPIVILRNTFLKPERGRSRKVVTAYAGKQAIYAMSEGNPRWLLGLLTDLFDKWLLTQPTQNGAPYVPYNEQAKILNATARRYHTSLAAAAIDGEGEPQRGLRTLVDILDATGEAIAANLLGPTFPGDPYGSFVVDPQPSKETEALIRKGVETGALVFIGTSDDDVPAAVAGSRFRLSFMLSPVYRLPFRNYRALLLSTLLERATDPAQLSLLQGLTKRSRR